MLSRQTLPRAICASLLCATLCNAAIPELLWSRTLLNSGTIEGEGLRKGNSVVLSGDEQSLWITTETGTLHVLDTNGNSIKTFHPETTADRYTESRSSVSLYQSQYPNQSIAFAVYAVIDVPHLGQNETNSSGSGAISSRIVSVNGGSSGGELGTLRWSTPVQGAIAGTPLISSDGAKIYVIHNTRNWAHVTVLESKNGKIIKEHMDVRPMMKYGPASLVTTAGIDSLYWADALNLGYARGGRVFTIKSTDLNTVRNPQSFASSTTMPPALLKNATSMWLGGRAATVHGWSGNSRKPIWSIELDRSPRNRSFPIVNRIETDDSEERLFVSSASNSFHCIDAQNGTLLWSTNSSASVFLTGAKYSPKYNVVYLIEHLSGAVTQHDAGTGVANWKFDCHDLGENATCQNSVEADFALSSDGTTLYYGDVYGRINAVLVAFKPTSPSHAPSAVPSLLPSQTPSSMPTLSQSQLPSQLPSSVPTELPSTAPSEMPSQLPSTVATEVPSTAPSASPSQLPSAVPTKLPSTTPSEMPSQLPSSVPLSIPVLTEVQPTTPSAFPSQLPSTVATKLPSTTPPEIPSQLPSSIPLGMPVLTEVQPITPSAFPSQLPSTVATKLPSTSPREIPSQLPSSVPLGMPVLTEVQPTAPSAFPPQLPSTLPTKLPSFTQSEMPFQLPSSVPFGEPVPTEVPPTTPSTFPSQLPSSVPTKLPSSTQSEMPAQLPSSVPFRVPVPTEVSPTTPSTFPSQLPSSVQSKVPSTTPAQLPSSVPIGIPSDLPFELPSKIPSTVPTRMPTTTPNELASQRPSSVPTEMPSDLPSYVPFGATSPRPTAHANPTPQNEPRESNNTTDKDPTPWTTSKPTAAPLPKVSAAKTHRLSISTLLLFSAAILSIIF